MRNYARAVGLSLAALVVGCGYGGPDVSPRSLPLATGTSLRASSVKEDIAYDDGCQCVPTYFVVVVSGRANETHQALVAREKAYLVGLGWRTERHYRDGSWSMHSSDGKVFSNMGWNCRSHHAAVPEGNPSFCASVADA
jgi:hypothetical protein